jgi:hypothetical protein
MRTRTFVALFVVVPALTLSVAGCGGAPPEAKVASPGAAGTVESTAAAAAAAAALESSVTAQKQAVEITSPDGGKTTLGGEVGKLPAGFPAGLPLYTKGVKAGAVVDTPKGPGFTVQMTTGDTVDATYKRYRSDLSAAGYKIVSGGVVTVKGVQRAFITFQKGTSTGLVNIVAEGEKSGDRTAITVQVVVPK